MGCGAARPVDTQCSPAGLRIGELLFDAEEKTRKGNHEAAMSIAQEARAQLAEVPEAEADDYSIMLYSREGKIFLAAARHNKAVEAFSKAIQLSEVKISQRCRGLYVMLQRYTDCMTSLVGIWREQAKAVATEAERARDHIKCEIALLRCIEAVEEGHNRRSDLLVRPLRQLSELYETLEHFERSELLLRRCQGILIVQYGHDHPDLVAIGERLKELARMKEGSTRARAAMKVQSTWKMHTAMKAASTKLGRPMRIHRLVPPAVAADADRGEFLAAVCHDIGAGTAAGFAAEAEGDDNGVSAGDDAGSAGAAASPPEDDAGNVETGAAALSAAPQPEGEQDLGEQVPKANGGPPAAIAAPVDEAAAPNGVL